ncbi:neuropeptide-like protein 32 [Trifolium pratense]|uniref:neuropeptide-like protein 32 n=1 Tax=Trifolium pratense TaxID=57577 RepID=UPI001E690A28|nr:neuropeptide-like protein 32 [Trifolium pratense]
MKIKSFIFVLYFCALILISVRAIELSNDGKQIGATEESNTKIVVDGDAGLQKGGHIEDHRRGHVDGGWGFWGSWGGWKGWIEWTGFGGGPKGKGGSVGNEGGGGGGGGGGKKGEQKPGWERVQNERPKWGGEEGQNGENRGTKERPWIPSTWIPNK